MVSPAFFGENKMENKIEKYFFGLDLSLNSTGISVFTTDDMRFVETSTIAIDKKNPALRETKSKLSYIGTEFKKYEKTYKPEFIVMEQGFMRYIKSTAQLMKVFGMTYFIFHAIDQYEVPATSIKKVLTGMGNADKEQVAQAVLRYYPGMNFTSTDESDACAVGIYWGLKQGWLKEINNGENHVPK